MDSSQMTALYNAFYYGGYCGIPYERNEHWLGFFGNVAERIVNDLRPRTVLDAGCAKGFLVEALRDRGVEAWGIDISEYAIEQVREDIRPFCRVGTLTEPLSQNYDLITCIEVLEHLSAHEAEEVIRNFCQHTDDILFSSSPLDYREATHINVRPPDYWAEIFARQGFFRDVDYDLSFLTHWGVRYRRTRESATRIVAAYERRLWQLQQERQGRLELTIEQQQQLSQKDAENHALKERLLQKDVETGPLKEQLLQKDVETGPLKKQLLQKDAETHALKERLLQKDTEARALKDQLYVQQHVAQEQRRELQQLNSQLTRQKLALQTLEAQAVDRDRDLQWLSAELHLVTGSRGWALLQQLWRLRRWLAPRGSQRARMLGLSLRALRVWQTEGGRTLTRRVADKLHITVVAPATLPVAESLAPPLGPDPYQTWIAASEPSEAELAQQRRQAGQFSYRPLISVITPVYNTPLEILRATIASVLEQTYAQWEFCLADGSTNRPEVRRLLEDLMDSDQRVKVKFLERNLGISGNSNEALALATGEFIALLDHDDLLAPNAFFEVVKLLNEMGEADLIYFDEDHVSSDGLVRRQPLFKPDWSPETLLSANYLTHCIIRRELITQVGAFDSQMDGAQDWDLFFRCLEKTKRIAHIPKVLYHWRQLQGSTAAEFDAKPYVFEAQKRSVEGHLQRRGIEQPRVTFPEPGLLRVTWPVPKAKVSIIIPTKDKVEFLRKCVSSITGPTTYPDFEILLIDNNSREEETWRYYESLASDSRIRLIDYPERFNYSAANNLGACQATGEFLLFLNNDTEALTPDWLEELVRWAALPEIGAVGAKLLYPDNTIQHAGVVMGMEGHASHVFWSVLERHGGPFGSVEWYRNYMAVTGACLMMRRSVFDEIGGFDEQYLLAFSDVEICLRLVAGGYRIVYTPFARLRHYEGRSRGAHIPALDLKRGYEHMKEIVKAGDPYFNPNLSYAMRVPTIVRVNEVSRSERLRGLLPADLVQDDHT
jgi:O-antigen biosynthesis protein